MFVNPPASLRLRTAAFIYDYGIIAAYLVLIALAGMAVSTSPGLSENLFGNPVKGQLFSFFFVTLPVCAYFVCMEFAPTQGTWGKVRQGIIVVGKDGLPLTLLRAAARAALKFLPWELSHASVWHMSLASGDPPIWTYALLALVSVLVTANVISVWISPSGQALYDRVVGSMVVRGYPEAVDRAGIPAGLRRQGP